jgi:hypothetical protein
MMNDKDALLDILDEFSSRVHWILDGMSLDTLRWQPDIEANNIAVTMWHISRSFDLLKVRVLENRPIEEELWRTKGWAAKTGYDPRGKGWRGIGNLGGYTRAEVQEVPILPIDEVLQYFDQTIEALQGCLESIPPEALHEIVPGALAEAPAGDHHTAYVYIRNFLMDMLGHLGEIRAIKAMKERKNGSA